MTLVSDIVTQALRENNFVGITQTPSDPEISETLTRLQSLLLATLGGDVGYNLQPWTVASPTSIISPAGVALTTAQAGAWEVPPNSRLLCVLSSAVTVALDPHPVDGQRLAVVDVSGNFATNALSLNGNGRRVGGAVGTAVLSTNDFAGQWLYRADLGDWVSIVALVAGSEFPMPEEFDDYFITSLAMRMSPRYRRALSQETILRLDQQRQQLVNRYRQSSLTQSVGGSNDSGE